LFTKKFLKVKKYLKPIMLARATPVYIFTGGVTRMSEDKYLKKKQKNRFYRVEIFSGVKPATFSF